MMASILLAACGTADRTGSQPPAGSVESGPRAADSAAYVSTAQPSADEATRAAFFRNLSALCGNAYEGRTEFVLRPDDPFLTARLVMRVDSCGAAEIRIPFDVDEDRSRTWILTLSPEGLLFKHDHRHPDGTPDEITMYGGWARPGGTEHRQSFPADAHTAELIPDAATNVWTLELDPERGTFTYHLERHDATRFRAVFDLGRPLAP